MPLLNYTTKVPVARTAAQVQAILAQNGAKAVMFEYDGQGRISALAFKVITAHGVLPIKMPLNADATFHVLEKQADEREIPRSFANEAHAYRVAWRIIKDWLEAQMSLLETEMVAMEEIFLPYVLLGEGETIYEAISSRGFKQLTRGEE